MNKVFSILFFAGLFFSSHVQGSETPSKGILDGQRVAPVKVDYDEAQKAGSKKIKHLIVIVQENWSFDSLYGKFPGVNGLDAAKPQNTAQANLMGVVTDSLQPCINTKTGKPYAQIPEDLRNRPFDLEPFIDLSKVSGDLAHEFYLEQYQINGGLMDQFSTYSDAGGFTASFYDIRSTSMGRLSTEFVICDNWFHSCYGGSMCGILWMFCAQNPVWMNAPKNLVAQLLPSGALLHNGTVTPDGYVVNDAEPFYPPHKKGVPDKMRVPPQTMTTIGDLLSQKKVTWKWYAEGWNDAVLGDADPTFAFHHQAPVYFKQFAPGTPAREEHLADLNMFYLDLKVGSIPEVCFIRSLDKNSQHPGDGSLKEGLDWCAQVVKLIQESPVWKECAIIVTYDENGGRWDHVPPPVVDRFGPGTRVPTVIISPFAKKGYVDKTSYESVSILKFIEERWELPSLSTRDKGANNILNAFNFDQ